MFAFAVSNPASVLYTPVRVMPSLQILVVMAMLVRLLDWLPALAGLLVTVAVIPVTAAIGRAMSAERKKMVAATDARVKLVSEVITGEGWLVVGR
jgi:hypothetical protein